MRKAYIVLGMKRSGHHAIAYWIAHNLKGQTLLHNDCSKGWGKGELIPSSNQAMQSKAQCVGEGSYIGDVYNIEDFNVNHLKTFDFRKFQSLKKYDKVFMLLVLRDHYNWIASSLKTGGGPAKRIVKRIELWKRQAKFCLDEKGYSKDGIFRISYNEWFSQENYRSALASYILLDSHDKGVNLTSPRGGGSSFDRMKFKRKAQQMNVLKRWKCYQKDTYFNQLIKDPELVKLSSRFFPNVKVLPDGK
jgi:hypothetical protein